jgi:hypothetical protein
MSWDATAFRELAGVREIQVVVPAPGRPAVRAPIWVVAVGGQLYVRSWKGDAGRWYRRARHYGEGSVITRTREYHVRFVPVAEPDLDAAIDKQFLTKYRKSRYARAMIDPPAAGTTLRLEPRSD